MTSRTPHRTARSSGFFDWIREAATVRSPKWLGGVAGGIATRVGIDPIIMRGIFVVLTLLGFPAVLLYGILWLVLPDEDGTIQLQELRHGRLHPVQLAIAVTFVLSLVPVGGVLWFGWAFVLGIVNSNYYYNIVDSIMWSPFSPNASGFIEWFVIVVVVIIVSAILIAVLRGGISAQSAAPRPSATVAHTPAEVPVAAEPAVVVPQASDAPADTRELKTHLAESDEAYREWREQQAKAHEEHENFRVDQLDDRAATARLKAEQREERTKFAQQAARQRAARRAANPRASVAYTVGIIGLAGVTASVVALVRAHAGAVEAIGLAALTAALILAAGMIVAGLLRRRSGFLAFTTVAALLIGGGSLAQARTNDLVWPGGSVYVGQLDSVNQPFGYLSIWTMNQPRYNLQPMRVVKGDGQTDIYVAAGTSLTLNVSIASNERWDTVSVEAVDGDNSWIGLGEPVARELVGGGRTYSITIDNPGQGMVTTPLAVDLTQAAGSVRVTIDRDWGGVNPTIGTFTDLNAEAKK